MTLRHGAARAFAGAGAPRDDHGRVVQVDPINPTLKAPGTKRLKLKCDDMVSSFAFKFNLRRYTMAEAAARSDADGRGAVCVVGRCRLTLSNPR